MALLDFFRPYTPKIDALPAAIEEQRAIPGNGGYAFADPLAVPPPGFSAAPTAGQRIDPTTVLTISTVHSAIGYLIGAIASRGKLTAFSQEINASGLRVKKYEDNAFLEDPFAHDWTMGNYYNRGMSQIVVSLALFSEAVLYVTRYDDRTGTVPAAVEVLHPAYLIVDRNHSDSQGRPLYKYGLSPSSQVNLDPSRLLRMDRISLPAHDRALSSLSSGATTYGIALAAQQYNALFFTQAMSTPFFLTADGVLSDDTAQRLGDKLRVEHTGTGNAHFPVITGQNIKVERTFSDPDDMQLTATRTQVIGEIAALFGLPAHLFSATGETRGEWGTSSEELFQQLSVFTFPQYTGPIEEGFSRLLTGNRQCEFPGQWAQASLLDKAQAAQALRQAMVFSPDEVRGTLFGIGPSDDPNSGKLVLPLASNTAPESIPEISDEDPTNN